MSDAQVFIFELDKHPEEATAIAVKTARQLESKELKLTTFIESLSDYINHDDAKIRAKAVAYLSEVLGNVSSKSLSGQQRNLLTDFVLTRVSDDGNALGQCANTLRALGEMGRWQPGKAAEIMEALFAGGTPLMQLQKQSERFSVLCLVDMLFAKYRNDLHAHYRNSPDFLSRTVSYFESEKDPRNLMIVFSILQVPISEWDLADNAQTLFDATFTYFPITFKPPKNDPYGITAEHLKDRLERCICSSSYMAPYTVPALLDRLDSTAMNTKRDTFNALRSCMRNYGPKTVSLYSSTIWDAVKFEVTNVQEDDLAKLALSVIAEIALKLSDATETMLDSYLRMATNECNSHLEDAPTKQSQGASRILATLSHASYKSFSFILQATAPRILALYQSAETLSRKKALVEVLKEQCESAHIVLGAWESTEATSTKFDEIPPALSNSLVLVQNALLLIVRTGSSSDLSLRILSLQSLVALVKAQNLLQDHDIVSIAQLLVNVINADPLEPASMSRSAAEGLVEISSQKPKLIHNDILPLLFEALKDKPKVGHSWEFVPNLEAIAKLSRQPTLFRPVIEFFVDQFSASDDTNVNNDYVTSLLSAILFVYQEGAYKQQTPEELQWSYENVLRFLMGYATVTDRQISGTSASLNDQERFLDVVGRIGNAIVRYQPLEIQKDAGKNVYTLWRDPENMDINPMDERTSAANQRLLILSTHLLAGLQRDVPLQYPSFGAFEALIYLCGHFHAGQGVRSAAISQVTLLVNKFIPANEVSKVQEALFNRTEPIDLSEGQQQARTRCKIMATKGAILRGTPIGTAMLQQLLDTLSGKVSYREQLAHDFSVLLAPSEFLTKENHCIIRPLHKQKVFSLALQTISNVFKTSTDSTSKRFLLIALTGILRWIPYSMLLQDVDQIATMLLQCLDLLKQPGETTHKGVALSLLRDIAAQNPEALEDHSAGLIDRLTSIAVGSSEDLAVRIAALKCLAMLPKAFKTEVLLLSRKGVISRLRSCLDDRKRDVRTEAVRCRARWIGVDEPDEE